MAVTWRNVEAPDFNSASRMMDRSADSFDKALNAFQNIGNDQRNMNLFKQGEERASNIQLGKEAILDGSATLDDWKNLDLGNTLEPYQDTKTREALMDFFNQRDDTLREETKADLSIDQANQSMRLAEAQNKRAIADEGRKNIRLNIDRQQAANQQKEFEQSQNGYFKLKGDQSRLDQFQNEINSMVSNNLPEDALKAHAENLWTAKDEKGKPLFTAAMIQSARTMLTQGIADFNSMTSTEQQQFTERTNEINAKYDVVGLKDTPHQSLQVLNAGIADADETIAKYNGMAETLKTQIQGRKTLNEAVKLAYGQDNLDNANQALNAINEKIPELTKEIKANIKAQLLAAPNPMSEAEIDRELKDYRINSGVLISAISGESVVKDWLDRGVDYPTNLAGNKYKLTNFTYAVKKDGADYEFQRILAKQAQAFKNKNTKSIEAINLQKQKEIAEAKKNILEANPNKKAFLDKLK